MKHDAAVKQQYATAGTPEAREACRLEWAKRQLENIRVGKQHVKSWRNVDLTKGELMNFGRVVEQYGVRFDSKAAVRCAYNYCNKAAKMGGGWSAFDEMAECMLFML